MTLLYEVIDKHELEQAIADGFVVKKHSDDGSERTMLTYTQKAYSSGWPDAVAKSRGLVYDWSGKVVAWPFERIHNLGTPAADAQGWDENPFIRHAYDKLDGSLVVMDELGRITTKGSFSSPQIAMAQEVLNERYPDFKPVAGTTYMFELLHPDNRIVLDYGQEKDLILLAIRDNASGLLIPPFGITEWEGTTPEDCWPKTASAARHFVEQRKETEGLVLWKGDGDLVKVKSSEYLANHRVMTGIDSVKIWEALAVGVMAARDMEAGAITACLSIDHRVVEGLLADGVEDVASAIAHLAELLPDEWHDWLYAEVDEILLDFSSGVHRAKGRAMLAVGAVNDMELDSDDQAQALYDALKPKEKAIRERDGLPMGAVLGLAVQAMSHPAQQIIELPDKTAGHILKAARPAKRTSPSSIRGGLDGDR